ncbi:MAG: phosphoribosyl-ATP diphosphatase [Firmicutes bacterium]|nr:phosphoribosyl-ATP diphosphatase [Bacillota bacterium]
MENVLNELYNIIAKRKAEFNSGAEVEKSHTIRCFQEGLDYILKKCGEECAETIISAKNGDKQEIISETADLFYHLMVMLAYKDIPLSDLFAELNKRAQKQGNIKERR